VELSRFLVLVLSSGGTRTRTRARRSRRQLLEHENEHHFIENYYGKQEKPTNLLRKAQLQNLVGKEEGGLIAILPLPVVAMGSVPHIVRRASFSQRATPFSLPRRCHPASVLESVAVEEFVS
jgi:hypothetical protein